jgi:hypothetical protein
VFIPIFPFVFKNNVDTPPSACNLTCPMSFLIVNTLLPPSNVLLELFINNTDDPISLFNRSTLYAFPPVLLFSNTFEKELFILSITLKSPFTSSL